MKKFKTATLLLIGCTSLFSLSGCEQAEQTANAAIEKAKQSAVQVLDDATQIGSIEQARQSANLATDDARQKAAGLLGQASEYLAKEQKKQDTESPGESKAHEDRSSTSL